MTPLHVADRVRYTAGAGVGPTEHVAFDAALLEAGVGDANLLPVSSVVPAGATLERGSPAALRTAVVPGGVYPVVGARAFADPGEAVHAAVGGCRIAAGHGLNVEVTGEGDDPGGARRRCRAQLESMARRRDTTVEGGVTLAYATTAGVDVEDAEEGTAAGDDGPLACAVAYAVYLDGE